MLTFESIKTEKPEMRDADISAFLRFADNFECLDSESYAEAKEKILISMQDVSDEMEHTEDRDEQSAIMWQRYSKFGR